MPPSPLGATRLVIATHNAGKLRELQALLRPYAAGITSSGELGLSEPVEDGDSFVANARLKALAAVAGTGAAGLADDSGLCITALKGEPGIYSARWALTPAGGKDFPAAMQRIHELMGDSPDRSACFVCALCLAWPDGRMIEVEGRLDGQIVWPPRGAGGHGYDPFFVPTGETRSLAELSDAEKNALSHRGLAIQRLLQHLAGGAV